MAASRTTKAAAKKIASKKAVAKKAPAKKVAAKKATPTKKTAAKKATARPPKQVAETIHDTAFIPHAAPAAKNHNSRRR